MKTTYPDINILPEEFRRHFLTRLEWVLVAVFLVGLVVLVSSFQALQAARDERAVLEGERRHLAATLEGLTLQVEQAQRLGQEIAVLEANLEKARQTGGVFPAQRLNWDALLAGVFVSPPQGIEIVSLTKGEQQLTINSISRQGYSAIARYHDQLKATPGVVGLTIHRTQITEDKAQGSYITFNLTVRLGGD